MNIEKRRISGLGLRSVLVGVSPVIQRNYKFIRLILTIVVCAWKHRILSLMTDESQQTVKSLAWERQETGSRMEPGDWCETGVRMACGGVWLEGGGPGTLTHCRCHFMMIPRIKRLHPWDCTTQWMNSHTHIFSWPKLYINARNGGCSDTIKHCIRIDGMV